MEISKRLKNLRIEHGLTQSELGERLNIGQATIACYESGQREPHISILIAYADFFECSLDYLTGRTDDFGNVVIDFNNTKKGELTLTATERDLLTKISKLNNNNKNRLIGYIEALSD